MASLPMCPWLVWASLLVMNAAACSDDGDDEATESGASETGHAPTVDYEADVQPIFNATCTCHLQGATSGKMQAPYLTLNPGLSLAQLVNATATQVPTMKLVSPGDPSASYLWRKLEGTAAEVGGEPTKMPLVGSLTEEQLDVIFTWILEGAHS